MLLLSPSLLSSNLGMLQQEVTLLQSAQIPWVHWDIMDGSYVPNITFGSPIIACVKQACETIFFDVHLMIEKPEYHVDAFIKAGANLIVIHPDSTKHPQRLLSHIKNAGIMAGVALNPHQNPSTIEYLMDTIDLVLIMSVNPGFSGQKFIPNSIQKIIEVRSLIQKYSASIHIQVDGGVSIENIAQLHTAGATAFVSGSSFFASTPKTIESYAERYKQFSLAIEQ